MKTECSGQPDISIRSRLSQHARQMGDPANGFFGDLSKNKMRPTQKNWASTLLALADLREPDIAWVVLIRQSGEHEEYPISNCIRASSAAA